jgi:thiol-disulfide isomerase/thioredoxin
MLNRIAAAVVLFACAVGVSQASPAAPSTSAQALSSNDLGYVAEDPNLLRWIGRPGPAITLHALGGGSFELAKLYGKKPVYLKLWASYCVPCRVQMPRFEDLYKRYGRGMQFIAVNAGVNDDAPKVRAFAAQYGIHMPVAVDDGGLGTWLHLHETPLHVLIGRDGRIAYIGHQDGPQLEAAIRRVIATAATVAPVAAARLTSVTPIKAGDTVPDLNLVGPDGRTIHFQAGATGRARVIVFTAVWCEDYLSHTEPKSAEACRRVREDADHLSKYNGFEWLIVANNLWTTPKDLASYKNKTKTLLPIAVDSDGRAYRVFGIKRFPTVALIGANGHLVRLIEGGNADLSAALKRLTKAS